MHKLEEAILNQFKKEPIAEISTGTLVRNIFIEQYDEIKEASKFRKLSVSENRKLKKKKAQLHRKLLYHLNKLEKEGIISNTGTIGKGEKKYRLTFEQGELIIEDKNKKIIINKPASITTRIDGYISQRIIQKYRPESWVNKKNAVLIESEVFSNPNKLHKYLRTIFPQINDVIAINNFQEFIDKFEFSDLEYFFHQLINDTEDYDLVINFIIDLEKLKSSEKLKEFLRIYSKLRPKMIRFIFEINPKQIRKGGILEHIIKEFLKIRVKINLKNNQLNSEPIFFGRAGPYSLDQKEFSFYKKKIAQGNYVGAIVSEATIAIDLEKIFTNGLNFVYFRELMSKAKKAMFKICRKQLRFFTNEFQKEGKNLFSLGKTYIRLWNYDYEEKNVNNYLSLLESIKEENKIFSNTQQNVYKSCGLPMMFNINLSSCFVKFDQDFLSERRYKKSHIGSLKQLQSIKETLEIRTRTSQLFEGADRFRIFVDKNASMDENLKILRYLFNLSQLPIISLDFRGLSGDLKLTNFL